jgi:hypothetical protein
MLALQPYSLVTRQHAMTHHDLLDALAQHLLDFLAKRLVRDDVVGEVTRALEREPLLGATHQLLALVVAQLLRDVLVDRVVEEQDLKVVVDERLDERRFAHLRHTLARDVVDRLLLLAHPLDVPVERRRRGLVVGRRKAQV